ncbi:MAG: amidohydrolase family protein, partial [Acidobacteria bacterium]|nr:amidohydrolase family protein [Acidobacteriota bacterium]
MAPSNDFDLVVRNGTVVTEKETIRSDVGVREGRVAALAARLPEGKRELDARGKLVLPGGIDSHCHVEQRSSMGITTADDFHSAGVSAACGGTTTLIPFAAQHRGESLREAVQDAHRSAAGKAFIDYAFHMIISEPTLRVLDEELPALVEEGHSSFKIYLTYDSLRLTDRQTLDVMAAARRDGALVMVHAENHDGVAWITEKLLSAGSTAPRFHALARPTVVEREAIHRVISLAEIAGAAVLIVHVSSGDGVEQIRWAHERGLPVYGETCPQYLLLTAENMDLPGFEGARFMCSPPLRDAATQEALWRGLASGALQVVSSDHAPYRYDDPKGKKLHGENAPFHKVPN